MSKLIVEVCKIDNVRPHPKPEVHSLEIVEIKGWQCVTKKGDFKPNDLVIFFPPDTLLPEKTSEKLGVTNYLHKQRVKTIKLKGEVSFGLVVRPDDPSWKLGDDVADYYGATKYEPPPPELIGRDGKKTAKYSGTLPDHPLFWKYTDMDNLRHFPDMFTDGEEVIMTEKIHGTNVRAGYVVDDPSLPPTLCVGSKNHRRKMPMKRQYLPPRESFFGKIMDWIQYDVLHMEKPYIEISDQEAIKNNWYWYPTTCPGVIDLLHGLTLEGHKQVELFGETYGPVQSMTYGTPTQLAFRAFDLIIDGQYVDYDRFVELCTKYGVDMVPLVYRGPYSFATAKKISMGPTLITGADDKHIREGVVVKPVKERHSPKIGRVLLKMISDEYLARKEPDKKGNIAVTDFQEQ